VNDLYSYRWQRWLAKSALMVAWPVIGALLLAMVALLFICCWLLIPFGRFVRDADGSTSMRFPWSGDQ
jgi:hypothetical protein